MADEQRCSTCAPGYDCERGIYTPNIREAVVVRPGDTLVVAVAEEHGMGAEEIEEVRQALKANLGIPVEVTVIVGTVQLAVVRAEAKEGDDGQPS